MEGVCPTVVGEKSDTSGRVGSTATITIDAGSRFIGGPYTVLWSKKPIAEESTGTDYILVTKGEFPSTTTKVTVTFTIPEASFGTNYVQFRRSWRPEDPYGFAFTVLPDIKVSPSSGSPGSKVTIKGTGFPANNKEVKLNFNGKDTRLTISTNVVGSFSAEFTIPNTIAGKHEFKATVENVYLGDIIASLQISPTISLEPAHPEVGAEVTVTGCGFASGSQVSIKYDDISISSSPTDKPPTTDPNGSFSHKFNVPASPKGKSVVTATDKAGNVATFGLPLEGEPPPAPNTITPGEKQQRFGAFGSQLVIFTWAEVSDPSGVTYILEIDNNLSFFPLEPGMRKTGLTKPNCTIQLEPGTYYWRVKAVDGAGNESGWALSPYPFKVGFFSTWYLVIGGLIFVIIFILIVRAFFRRLREYLK
ncbi:MAG: hypothetical protein FJ005_05140 [Chloroflexi bacterium]|nr:hypothetical protein [Chloroflexota bacterium]